VSPIGGIIVDFLVGLLGCGEVLLVPVCLLPVECRRIGIIPANLLLDGGASSSVEGTWRKFEVVLDIVLLLIFTKIYIYINIRNNFNETVLLMFNKNMTHIILNN